METVQTLRNRIESAQDLHSVVKTMKSMAAVNIRQYEQAVEALRGYNGSIELGLQILLRHRPDAVARAQRERQGPVAALVFGSDQGMAGSLNREIVERVVDVLGKPPYAGRAHTVGAVGIRAAAELEAADVAVAESLTLPRSPAGLTGAVLDALACVEAWREETRPSDVVLVYQRPSGGASYAPAVVTLLPLDIGWLRELARRPWPTRGLPTFTMAWEPLFAAVVRQYLFVALYRGFAESLASENASRLASMQAAENNIEERLDDLEARYRRQRQSAITEELLDVVSGFEALGGVDS